LKKLGARTAAEPVGSVSGSMTGDAWFRAVVGLIAIIESSARGPLLVFALSLVLIMLI
jgi:hypothetical protein